MHILITGGSGFLGARLARTLLARGSVSRGGAAAQAITRITLADRAPPPADLAADARVQFVGGLGHAGPLRRLFAEHLGDQAHH